ncbi:MAG: delta-60 repeat domain-containing protein, partial [Flavobacteriales bacterium]|nr:delta-60 repeat domain-containing protein [Flavobacteriales bacterium]
MTANGTLDPGFQVGTGFDYAPMDFCVQSDGRIVVVGATSYNGIAINRIVRLNADGSRDNTFQTGTGFTGTSSPYTVGCNSTGIYIAGGPQLTYNGTVCGSVVRLFYNGALDTGFTPSVPWNQFAYHIAVTNFDLAVLYVSGISSFELRRYLPSGATDGSFTTLTGTGGDLFGDLVRTSSGGYYIGGSAGTVSGQAHGGLFRVTPAGQLDATFNANIDLQGTKVYAVGVQSDGKVIALCSTQSEYEAVKCEGRLKPNVLRFTSAGSLDVPYSPGSGFYPYSQSNVKDMVVQSDGKIIATGDFKSYDQYSAGGICRMSADGAWDATFLATGVGGIGPSVNAVALQADGKIIAGGYFTTFNGQPAGAFVRLNTNGTTDNTFLFGAGFDAAATVHAILIQPDGKFLLAGRFTTLNGTACGDVVRLNADGTVDATFSGPSVTSASGDVLCLERHPDGRVYIGGSFTALNGTGVNRAARLTSTGAVDATFNVGSGF